MEFRVRADGEGEALDGARPAGGLAGTFERFRLWLRILSRLRAEGPRMRVGLLASAFLDVALFATARERATSPRSYVAGVVSSARPAARFRVRAGTDDIYNVMPRREGDVEDTILNHLRAGDTFVDVGASVGYYSVVAAAIVGPHGRVVAIEPIPETYELLRVNMALNGLGNVTPVAKASWARRGTVTLTVPRAYYGLASASTPRVGRKVPVEAAPLDDLTSGLPSVQVLKVDAEGAELEVLEGATETLAKTRFVVLEVTQHRASVEALLRGHSFSLERSRDYPSYLFASRP
jgi:FkbM family methyltransferase